MIMGNKNQQKWPIMQNVTEEQALSGKHKSHSAPTTL